MRYDVANPAGAFTGLEGYVTRQWFDTNLLAFTTNWFECLDIQLTNGANTITLYATDRAGNVSTSVLSYTLDYSGVTSGPALTPYWPQDGAQVSGTSFTLRGLLDDPTATVTAQITDANGVIGQVEGLVERNGLLWVENLPLGPGANMLTLMMTNAAGLPSSTSLTVTQSDVVLTIADLSATGPQPTDNLRQRDYQRGRLHRLGQRNARSQPSGQMDTAVMIGRLMVCRSTTAALPSFKRGQFRTRTTRATAPAAAVAPPARWPIPAIPPRRRPVTQKLTRTSLQQSSKPTTT